jgi:predicted RNA binding protein YcfA (HicA-like mRNA interferase family)
MTKLPSSEKIIKVLQSQGFNLKSQKGSHQKLSNGQRSVIVPAARKEIPIGTLKSISRQSGIDYESFINL